MFAKHLRYARHCKTQNCGTVGRAATHGPFLHPWALFCCNFPWIQSLESGTGTVSWASFHFCSWWAGMVGPERHKMKEGLKGLATQRNFQGFFFFFYSQSGTILSMQFHMSRQSEIPVIEAELGVLDLLSFNILWIFSHVLRWLLKPLHRMQFKTPVLGSLAVPPSQLFWQLRTGSICSRQLRSGSKAVITYYCHLEV